MGGDYHKLLKDKLQDHISSVNDVRDLNDLLWLLAKNNYYDIHIWNKGLRHYESFFERAQESNKTPTSFKGLDDNLEVVKMLDIWAHFLVNIAEGEEFKYHYYSKLYRTI